MQSLFKKVRLLLLGMVAIAATAAFALAGTGAANASGYDIYFAPGSNHASVSGTVWQGGVDSYRLEARAGQTQITDLTSVQGTARFTIIAPNGHKICVNQTWSKITLPQNGWYTVQVYPTHGDANYTLSVTIN
ncbi:hypothetical protein [Nocardia sp. NPDC052566]|uniref:hypothetical protein n=1 Tax=Nocardia sp. NPDC052566 TaxID=3364330 RepID=UPI0037C97339